MRGVAVIAWGLIVAGALPAAGQRLDLAALRQLRREAAHRPRRMIFNNDGDDVIYYEKKPTREALLAVRTTPLVGSQVDSIFYSNSMCFGDALHDSRVFRTFLSREDIFKDNPLEEYVRLGIDPIQVMADFGRRHGMEVFWDFRVNDTHDAGLTGYGPLLLPQLKKDHPEFLVGTPDNQPPHGTWSSVDYAKPQVRELAYRFFEEVCRKFDVDGIELDFLRHACFFRSVAWGGKASRRELDMMTDLLRRTRRMTEREGLRRGRPILLAIRIPDSVEYCQAIGLDVERWLAEGLVDILSGTCYFQLNPWEYLVQLGHRYDVPVYPSLSESRVQGEARFSRNSLESYRARAMQAWAAGADGIYMFNYFDPRGAVWRELGDRRVLAHKDKLYFLSPRNGRPEWYLAEGRAFQHLPILTPENPCLVPGTGAAEFDLAVGDGLAAAAHVGLKPEVTCHVRTLGAEPLTVTLNGRQLPPPAITGQWQDFPVAPDLVKVGNNRVAIALGSAPAEEARWTYAYEGAKLPEAPWQKDGFYTETGLVTEVQDGKLLIADRTTESGGYAYYKCPCFVRPEDEIVVEARVKVISGWNAFILENGTRAEEFQLYPDQVRSRHSDLRYAMDTTDAFHTYRVVARGDDFRLYVDGELRLDGPNRMVQPAPGGRSGVMFGAANSDSLGEALWEYVKIRNPAVTLLDLVLQIKYGKG